MGVEIYFLTDFCYLSTMAQMTSFLYYWYIVKGPLMLLRKIPCSAVWVGWLETRSSRTLQNSNLQFYNQYSSETTTHHHPLTLSTYKHTRRHSRFLSFCSLLVTVHLNVNLWNYVWYMVRSGVSLSCFLSLCLLS